MFEKGESNPNWKGGIFRYPNHALMKRLRLKKLKQVRGKCEVCGDKAAVVHHIDDNPANQSIENFAALCHSCHSCHSAIHAGRNQKTSKFIRLYGMTLEQMALRFGGSLNHYHYLHKTGKLKSVLQVRKKLAI